MASRLGSVTLLLVLATSADAQFFDFFDGFQPVATNRPAFGSSVTQRPHRGKQTTKEEETTKSYENDRYNNPISPQFNLDVDHSDRRRKNTSSINYTTVKPKKKSTTRRLTNDRRNQNFQDNSNKEYDGKINAIGDYDTQKPNYGNNNDYYTRKSNFNNENYYTENPFNKGVRPIIANGPPITNRPVTKRPSYGVNPRPRDEDSIIFPQDDTTPEIIMGPDEDYMSEVEKKRYIELAERKCDEFKALQTKSVQAIPLVPSPEPVQINIAKCAPTKVPLVVGGKVVDIQEFPHMALLGWRKIQAAGYSWKCGGSLVSEQYVLTAAHCSYQDRDNTVVNGPPSAVQLGSSYLDDPGALVVRVAAVIRHPKYKLPRSYFDLALIKLVSSVKISEVIKPACLGTAPAVGKSIIATGWGRTEYGRISLDMFQAHQLPAPERRERRRAVRSGQPSRALMNKSLLMVCNIPSDIRPIRRGDQSQELRSVSLPIWEMPRCQEVLGTSRKLPQGPSSESQICAGEERGGKDTCQGDSGGPAQVQDGCIWRIVGVTSLGRSCGAAETPGLYAKVQRAFIASQIFGSQSIRNYTSNNPNYGNNNDDYGTNNRNYGNNSANSGNNNGNSNVNYNNRRPQGSQDGAQRPYHNVNYDSVSEGSGVNNREQANNRGRPYNQQDNNNYNSQGTNNRPTRYTTTHKPNKDDSFGFYNNEYNNQQNNQNYYTTRRPDGNNDYYNSQNYGNNNRDQSDFNRNNNYGYNNQPTQRAQNNYGDNRRSNIEVYTVNIPWW